MAMVLMQAMRCLLPVQAETGFLQAETGFH